MIGKGLKIIDGRLEVALEGAPFSVTPPARLMSLGTTPSTHVINSNGISENTLTRILSGTLRLSTRPVPASRQPTATDQSSAP